MRRMRTLEISFTLVVFRIGSMSRSFVYPFVLPFLGIRLSNADLLYDDRQVIYHYIQRDLDNCASKLAREAKIHPEDWRVLAGIAGCTGDEQYQETELSTPLWEPGSFYAAATKDTSMQRSYYGTHLGDLLIALGEVVEDYRAGRMPGMVGEKITRVVDIPEIIYRSAVV